MLSHTSSYDPSGRPVVQLHLGAPTTLGARWRRSRAAELRSYRALIDTGAIYSCVTTSAAHMEGLLVQSKRRVEGIHGAELANAYIGDVGIALRGEDGLSHLVALQTTLLLEIRGGLDCDLLLGRDFLSLIVLELDGVRQRLRMTADYVPTS